MVLTVFINFTALPGFAVIFGFELPQTNVVVSEEEHSHAPVVIYEKALPKVLNVNEFLKFSAPVDNESNFKLADDKVHISPFITIFSPPPEA